MTVTMDYTSFRYFSFKKISFQAIHVQEKVSLTSYICFVDLVSSGHNEPHANHS